MLDVTTLEPAVSTVGTDAVTGTFQALGHRFRVRSNDRRLVGYLERLLASLAVPADGGETCTYEMTMDHVAGRHVVRVDGHEVGRTAGSDTALGYLLWHVNQEAVRRTPGLVLLHAAVAVRDGVAVLFPAEMEAGKTTLVAGLVERGYGYLSDEIAALDPDTLHVHPYPKPMSLDPGSWGVLAALRPVLATDMEAYAASQWHIPVDSTVGSAAASVGLAPRIVIAPRYEPGSTTALTTVPRAEMLLHAAQQTFHFHDRGRRNFRVLAEVFRGADCYRLTVSDLDRACDLVDAAVERVL